MNCDYCKRPCQQDGTWWDCLHCEVCYEQSETLGRHIKFERMNNDWAYALNLYPEKNLTVLTAFKTTAPIHERHEEIRIPYLMKNVNQHNAMDKIRMLLIFQ